VTKNDPFWSFSVHIEDKAGECSAAAQIAWGWGVLQTPNRSPGCLGAVPRVGQMIEFFDPFSHIEHLNQPILVFSAPAGDFFTRSGVFSSLALPQVSICAQERPFLVFSVPAAAFPKHNIFSSLAIWGSTDSRI